MRRNRVSVLALVAAMMALLTILPLRAANENINYADINKIKAEGHAALAGDGAVAAGCPTSTRPG